MLRVGLILCALAAAARAGERAEHCKAGWQEKYASDWGLDRQRWDAACESSQAEDVLRQVQGSFMQSCRERFASAEQEKKLAPGLLAVLCAQGRPGQAQLEAMTGTARQSQPEAPKASEPVRPAGSGGMGPLMSGLKVARASWRSDACFSGLYYSYAESTWIDPEEWSRWRREHGHGLRESLTDVEQYSYFFNSPSAQPDYRVIYGDEIDETFCSSMERLKGPEAAEVGASEAFASCLQGVEIDLSQAVKIAAEHGLKPGAKLWAFLGVFPRSFFSQHGCRLEPDQRACSDAPWDTAKLRRVWGTEVWAVVSNGKTAFIDARKGRFRFLGPGGLDIPAAHSSSVFGIPCEHHNMPSQ
jgi:hypothetical protein